MTAEKPNDLRDELSLDSKVSSRLTPADMKEALSLVGRKTYPIKKLVCMQTQFEVIKKLSREFGYFKMLLDSITVIPQMPDDDQ